MEFDWYYYRFYNFIGGEWMIFKVKWWYYVLMFDLNRMDAEMYNKDFDEAIKRKPLSKAENLNKKIGKHINKMRYYNEKKTELLLSVKGDK